MFSFVFRGVVVVTVLSRVASAQCGAWDAAFRPIGVDQRVTALIAFDDGSGPALFAGGEFTSAGGTTASNIAEWNGTSWSPLDFGVGGTAYALEAFDDGSGVALYAGGNFLSAGLTPANHIAKWNGTSWSPLGLGTTFGLMLRNGVYALEVFDDGSGPALYAGGLFDMAGGGGANSVAKWNGTSWSPLGVGVGGTVYALKTFDDGSGSALYAAGSFTSAGGASASQIAKWNGSSWSALGSGLNNYAFALEVFDDGSGPALYAGGAFTTAGGAPASRIAKWDGASWSALDSGVGGTSFPIVQSLFVFDDGSGPALYAGGDFTTAGAAAASRVAKWDGTSWSALGAGTSDVVLAIHAFDAGSGAKMCAGGNFVTAGSTTVNRIAEWSGTDWTAVSTGQGIGGASPVVQALETFDDGSGPALFAGGFFESASSLTVSSIARWNGSSWSALGSGIGGPTRVVYALQVHDDGAGDVLFAAGAFSSAGGVSASNIAKWNGTTWSALTGGIGGARVYALHVFDDGAGPRLFAAGDFFFAGGSAANIAKWNGTSWSALGSGANSYVSAIQAFDDGSGPALYAGGNFTGAGGVGANRIARWNGTSWSSVGTGMNSRVEALAVYDDGSGPALYAGGEFTTAGGNAAAYIAKWNGAVWSALGSGMNGWVQTLAVHDDGTGPALYAGGDFTQAGGVAAALIAKWNGTSWSAIAGAGSGVNGTVYALQTFDDGDDADGDLFVGGYLGKADGIPSARIAQWHGCGMWSFCFGDGTSGACPCSNNGVTGHGCNNSSSTGGALLTASGVASLSNDSALFTATGEKPTALSILAQGQTQIAAVPFGQGLRCVAGNLKRMYVKQAVSGAFSAPTGADPSVHVRSAALGDAIPAGASRYYYAYYRDATVLGGCSPASTFNATQSLRLIWAP